MVEHRGSWASRSAANSDVEGEAPDVPEEGLRSSGNNMCWLPLVDAPDVPEEGLRSLGNNMCWLPLVDVTE